MGRKRAKVVSRDAFAQAFVEAEYVMRKNLAARIANEATEQVNEDFQAGMIRASEIVFGKVEEQVLDAVEEAKQDDVG